VLQFGQASGQQPTAELAGQFGIIPGDDARRHVECVADGPQHLVLWLEIEIGEEGIDVGGS
jgi:hypothetical protein